MKLTEFHPSPERDSVRIAELEHLLAQPFYKEVRPCPGCNEPCPCSASKSCTCQCSSECAHAPFVMSSDPERYPIERNIVGLVFELNCLRVCPPYWSCEGHQFPNGELLRVPQVWFYSRSMIYPKLIGDYVTNLHIQGKISCPWHICLAYSDDSLETGFKIEPDVVGIKKPDIDVMQSDAEIISRNMYSGLHELAQGCLNKIQEIAHNKQSQ